MRQRLFMLFVLLLIPTPAFAADALPMLSAQPRHRPQHWELVPYGGFYLGRSLGQTWTAGMRGHYRVNDQWAIGAQYGYVAIAADSSSAFGRRIVDTKTHLANAEVQISNDAALRLGQKVLAMDFYLTLGTGALRLNTQWEPFGLIGGGVKMYPGPSWFAVAVDVNNYAHFTQVSPGRKFDVDTLFTVGFAFLLP
jgi:outer membrane beta-barrel protein